MKFERHELVLNLLVPERTLDKLVVDVSILVLDEVVVHTAVELVELLSPDENTNF